MDIPNPEIDHYTILGLPSGEEGSKLTLNEIEKAYRQKALILHPDKNPNNPNATTNFTQLKTSLEILKHDSSRKLFDDLLKLHREAAARDRIRDAKRCRMASDLEKRERNCADGEAKARRDEEISKKFTEEVRSFREMLAKKRRVETESETRKGNAGGVVMDKSKMLKVSWEKGGVNGDYTAQRLRELFSVFGEVEDVLIRKKRSAIVVMESKEAVVAALGVLIGDSSNPLLVLPLQPINPMPSFRAQEPVANKDDTLFGNLVGAGHKAYENSVLEKLKKAAQKQKEIMRDTTMRCSEIFKSFQCPLA